MCNKLIDIVNFQLVHKIFISLKNWWRFLKMCIYTDGVPQKSDECALTLDYLFNIYVFIKFYYNMTIILSFIINHVLDFFYN